MYLLSDVINSAGLALDIGGVILLFIYGLPERVDRFGSGADWTFGVDEEEAKKYKRYKKNSFWGLGFLVLGFFLQLVSNWI